MICLEFRRRLYVDPNDCSLELQEHRAQEERVRSVLQWRAIGAQKPAGSA